MGTTPCPPRYATPTHEQTLIFSKSSHVRGGSSTTTDDDDDDDDGGSSSWYECIVPAYCNSPPFLGYTPPGVGAYWKSGWAKLVVPLPCDPSLDESVGGGGDDDDGDASSSWGWGIANGDVAGGIPAGAAPTSAPTPRSARPSSISGALWYDANSDGRINAPLGSWTVSDLNASSREGGAGLGNAPVSLRRCATHELVGYTTTGPRSDDGVVRVVDAGYLDEAWGEGPTTDAAAGGIGGGPGGGDDDEGSADGRLGYYRFHILPHQVPGEYYVALEAPPGYRITGGAGEEWEVYRSAMYDKVRPVPTMEAPWLLPPPAAGDGSNNSTSAAAATTTTADHGDSIDPPADGAAAAIGGGAIVHSGRYAASRCFDVRSSPTRIGRVDAGLARDDGPPSPDLLAPHQYASLVVVVRFYAAAADYRRRRHRDLQLFALECREYEKAKSEGIYVEDAWGCEGGGGGGAGGGPTASSSDLPELSLEEGDLVASAFREFLDSRLDRVWTVKVVSLAYQEVGTSGYDDDDDDGRSGPGGGGGSRVLASSREFANLLLGFRVRAEFPPDRYGGGADLAEVVVGAVRAGSDSLLAGFKRSVPTYAHFSSAGAVDVRATLRTPENGVASANATEWGGANDTASSATERPESSNNSRVGKAVGVVSFVVVLALVAAAVFVFRRRRRGDEGRDGSMGKKATSAVVVSNRNEDSSGYYSSDHDDVHDDGDDLSSRFYSDSSRYDHVARLRELRGFEGATTGGGAGVGEGRSSRNSPEGGWGDIVESYHRGYESGGGAPTSSNPSREGGGASRGSRISSRSGAAASGRYSRKYPGGVDSIHGSSRTRSSNESRGDGVGESYYGYESGYWRSDPGLASGASRKSKTSTGSSTNSGRCRGTAESYRTIHSRSSVISGVVRANDSHHSYESEATRSNPILGSGASRKSGMSTRSGNGSSRKSNDRSRSGAESYGTTQSRSSIESGGVINANCSHYSYESEATRSNPSLGSGVSRKSKISMRSGATPSSLLGSSRGSSRRSMMVGGSVSQEADGYSVNSSQLSRIISEIT